MMTFQGENSSLTWFFPALRRLFSTFFFFLGVLSLSPFTDLELFHVRALYFAPNIGRIYGGENRPSTCLSLHFYGKTNFVVAT